MHYHSSTINITQLDDACLLSLTAHHSNEPTLMSKDRYCFNYTYYYS